jgi:hypothetical protein
MFSKTIGSSMPGIGLGVDVGGMGVGVGGMGVNVGGMGVDVEAAFSRPHAIKTNITNTKPNICRYNLVWFIVSSFV